MKDIAIASDHGGFELKQEIKDLLEKEGFIFIDFGTLNGESVDYPDYAEKVALAVSRREVKRGILICGTGIGMCIVANKFPHVRAGQCHDIYTARMSREHNDSNILVLGGRTTDKKTAREIVKTWLNTEFTEGRHRRRVNKITDIENRVKGLSSWEDIA